MLISGNCPSDPLSPAFIPCSHARQKATEGPFTDLLSGKCEVGYDRIVVRIPYLYDIEIFTFKSIVIEDVVYPVGRVVSPVGKTGTVS